MAHLALSFLGGFQVFLDGRPVTEFKSNKVRALLAYLAVEADRPHRREALAGLLWPERTDRDAFSNLRYTLANLRATIGDRSTGVPTLLITHDTIQFNRASDTWLDVLEFERQLATVRTREFTGSGLDNLKAAVSLYHGGFLEGFSVAGAAPFEEWALLRREQIARHVMTALAHLVAEFETRGQHSDAQICARRQVALEPWDEEAHRALMRTLALGGQRTAALHQFELCRRILKDELGVEPAEETVALYEEIRAGRSVDREPKRQEDKAKAPPLGAEAPWAEPHGDTVAASPLLAGSSLAASSPSVVVAREEQLVRLQGNLAQALAGAGHVVFVSGEAGSGKTVLMGEFARRAMQNCPELLVATGACDAAGGIGDPYLPFREILQVLTGDIEAKRAGAALTPEHARRLWAAIPDALQALAEEGPGLIDTFVPGSGLALRAEAFAGRSKRIAWQGRLDQVLRAKRAQTGAHVARQSDQQRDFFEQINRVLQALALRHPLCLVLDDLQWADAGSISLLFHLGRRIATSRILVVASFRRDAIAAKPEPERHSLEMVVNELERISGQEIIDLDACEGRQFVTALLRSEPNRVGPDFGEMLFRRTEGHPLFTVELLRSLEERGDLARDSGGCWKEGPALHWDTLPRRVEAAIAERIGRLPDPDRTLLAVASVEGDEFTAEAVARALDADERAVLQCLSDNLARQHRLVAAVSLSRLDGHKLSRYRFRHHLFQQYLYGQVDAVRRAHLHEAIGSALEVLCGEAPDELDRVAPRLAWHFEQAGLAERSAIYHLRAGNRATKLAAHQEAIDHLTSGLALLEGLPDTPERVRLKLDLQLAVASPIAYLSGDRPEQPKNPCNLCNPWQYITKELTVSVSRLTYITPIGVEQMGDLADSLRDPEVLRLENLDTDLRPPQSALEVTKQAVDDDNANSYLPFFGLDVMRQAAAGLVARQSSQPYDWKTECVISAGGLSGILNVLLATLEPGDEVLLSDPIYVGLVNRVRLAGGVPRFAPLIPSAAGWRLDLDALAQIDPSLVKAALLMSPAMPTGAVFTADEWQALIDFCQRAGCWLIDDSAMERILYDGRAVIHPASFPGMRDQVITVGSASKEYRMIGWRVGWVVGPARVVADVARISISNVVCQTGIAMGAVAAAIDSPDDGIASCVAEWQRRRDLLLEELAGLPVIPPHGGWSMLLDVSQLGFESAAASKRLLELGKIAATPMVNWGSERSNNYVRFVFANEPVERLCGMGMRVRQALA